MRLIGLGGHSKHVIDALVSRSPSFLTFTGYDDNGSGSSNNKNVQLLGTIDQLIKSRPTEVDRNTPLFCCIGDNAARKRIVEYARARGFSNWPECIHAGAIVSSCASIGPGVYVGAGATITGGATVAAFAYINDGAHITHDVTVGPYAHIAPGATLLGGVVVGEGALIGGGAVVLPGIRIGAWVIVGAGSTVTKDVPENSTVRGNPAR